jgi:hypothetical protein
LGSAAVMPFAAFRHILARGFIGFYCFALHLCFDQGPLQYLAGDHVSLLWVGLSFTRPLCLRSAAGFHWFWEVLARSSATKIKEDYY